MFKVVLQVLDLCLGLLNISVFWEHRFLCQQGPENYRGLLSLSEPGGILLFALLTGSAEAASQLLAQIISISQERLFTFVLIKD